LDSDTSVAELKERVARFRDERNWAKFNNPKDLSMAISIESAELQELFLWKDTESVSRIQEDEKLYLRVREEAADVCIYLLSLFDVLHLDLSDAVADKLAENARKYPVDKSKGSSKKYDEL